MDRGKGDGIKLAFFRLQMTFSSKGSGSSQTDVEINGATAGILVLSELVKQLRSVNENLEGIVAHVAQLGIEARQLREVLEIQGVGGITGI